jgi:hypothetical protein
MYAMMSAIDVFSMTHLYDKDISRLIIHCINNPVPPLTYTITILMSELLTVRWPRIVCQGLDTLNNPLTILFLTDPLDFIHSRRLDQEIISSHSA